MTRKSRMFHLDTDYPIETWNPIVGCKHHCYSDGCWAARIALRLKENPYVKRYRDGFDHPKLIEQELKKVWKPNVVVFVVSMGDMWAAYIKDEWIDQVLKACRNSPGTIFFFETKNPMRYYDWLELIPENVILSSTIETNRDYNLSEAPEVKERYLAMKQLQWQSKHVSIEPIVDFDLKVVVRWFRDIEPIIVSVGYDNYGCGLPEPSLSKTMKLIGELKKFTKVERKQLREKKDLSPYHVIKL